jgi:hypothetical protein
MIVRAVETMTRFVPVSMHRHLEEEADVYDLCFVKVPSQLLAERPGGNCISSYHVRAVIALFSHDIPFSL